jgi:xanthine dehydrogenase accessory factor
MREWIAALDNLLQSQHAAVLVTVATIKGSTPREAGARMLITEQGNWGTIGGGNLEFQAMDIARNMLSDSQPSHFQRFTLGAGLGQCCGGVVTLMFERFVQGCIELQQLQQMVVSDERFIQLIALDDHQNQRYLISQTRSLSNTDNVCDQALVQQARNYLDNNESSAVIKLIGGEQDCSYFFDPVRDDNFHIMIFGAGHVGQAVVKILADQACHITWVDTRDNQFPDSNPDNVSIICSDTPEAEIEQATAGTYFLVMTHDHQLDQQLAQTILKRSDFAYFGLIGSSTKRHKFEHRLRARGISDTALSRMICPIGIDGIYSKQPAAIALSVSAQIIQLQQQLARQQQVFQQQAVN